MQRHKNILPLMLVLAVTALSTLAATAMVALRGQNQPPASRHQQQKVQTDYSDWPIADYDAPEPDDPKKREKRQKKNGRHKSGIAVAPNPGDGLGGNLFNDWEVGLPSLPVNLSDAVIVSEITNAEAYLSADKLSLFSEFTVRITEVLKSGDRSAFEQGATITVEREGGRVKYPTGKILYYLIAGQRMPRVGARYLLFLKHEGEEHSIITGYELQAGRVRALDELQKFKALEKFDEANFLQEVRNAIKSSLNPPSQERI
ncbi:MAG TPA: hypothetical protein VD835_12680 [Pyrinomonadaceae bacterium]|nr:hypothetical protein [Pyrinomonadaceae bacterium]